MEYPARNNTNFPLTLKTHLANLKYGDKELLLYNQYVVLEYFKANPSSRGLLEFFDMGLGKTILAASITYFYKKHDPDRRIVIISPKSLAPNFKKAIREFMNFLNISDEEIDEYIESTYKFVSLNAGNMFEQMKRTGKTKEQISFEKKIEKVNEHVTDDDNFLENTMLVIDEAHNFFNSITNGSKNALSLYDAIVHTQDIRLLFLTGTPIVNNPFELVPCFNMLAGSIKVGSKSTLLFPEDNEKFNNFFVDHTTHQIKNRDKFHNRITGMVSYYGDIYFKEKPKEFPKKNGPDVVKVNMSSYQFTQYEAARDMEREESSFSKKKPSGRFASGASSSSYRIKSRLASNFAFPEHALGKRVGKKSREKFLAKLTDDDLTKNLSKHSPKMVEMLKYIKKQNGAKGTVYSQFVSGEGLGVFAKILELNGYSKYVGDKTSKKTYMLITGGLTSDERNDAVEAFNSDKIELLLFSKAGAEGLDLKGSRHVHVMEPFWNYALIRQVIHRSIRFKSHTHLPKNQQDVTVYVYLSTYPKDFTRRKKGPTTDEDLFTEAKQKDAINKSFLTALPEISIDCHAHAKNFDKTIKIRCKLCEPTNKPLFHPILNKDMQLPNPCNTMQKKKISAKECVFEGTGEKFYFTKDVVKDSLPKINIYRRDAALNGYILLDPASELYNPIYTKILTNKC